MNRPKQKFCCRASSPKPRPVLTAAGSETPEGVSNRASKRAGELIAEAQKRGEIATQGGDGSIVAVNDICFSRVLVCSA